MTDHPLLSRRHFLAGASALSGSSILAGFAHAAPSAKIGYTDNRSKYKALVCILLAGGCDSFNLLMPRSGAAYNAYAATRTNLALTTGDMHAIRDARSGETFGLHPSTQGLQTLFDEQRLSFVSNIAPLIEPTTKEQFEDGSVILPNGLMSHSDQIDQWQTSQPQSRTAKGWGGLALEKRIYNQDELNIPVNISLSGTNIFQFGDSTNEFAISNKGSSGVEAFGVGDDAFGQAFRAGIENVLRIPTTDPMKAYYANTITGAHDTHEFFSEAIKSGKELTTNFPRNRFGRDMRMIARIIAANQALDAPQQIFFVTYGGWDHHDNVLSRQNDMLGVLSNGLMAFDAALSELDMQNNVTTFTISDFGRTLTSNGNGSDHGWGGNMMVMGGQVDGGKIFGEYPDLTLDNPLDIGGGILIPTLPTDSIYRSLGDWFGVPPNAQAALLPNLANFAPADVALDVFR